MIGCTRCVFVYFTFSAFEYVGIYIEQNSCEAGLRKYLCYSAAHCAGAAHTYRRLFFQ